MVRMEKADEGKRLRQQKGRERFKNENNKQWRGIRRISARNRGSYDCFGIKSQFQLIYLIL